MTKLVAIINITPDSFSDGGETTTIDAAITKIINAIELGVDIVDIGAESTRPDATPLTDAEEWQRLEPILTTLKLEYPNIPISIDSYHPITIERACELGSIHMINDVRGLTDNNMIAIAKASKLPTVMMHSLDIPTRKEHIIDETISPIITLNRWIEAQLSTLEQKQLDLSKLIIDPGIGFGKNAEQSWELLRNIDQLDTKGLPLYIGHSRKSFLQTITNAPPHLRDTETLGISAHLMQHNVEYLRIHAIGEHIALKRCTKELIRA